MRVKKSTIDGAGKGLFVTRNIPAGADLGEYTGQTRPASAPPTPYDLGLNGGRKVDGSNPLRSSVLRFVNHKPFAQANAAIVARDRGTPVNGCRMIRTKRAMKADSKNPKEVFFDYGNDYWRQNRAKAARPAPAQQSSSSSPPILAVPVRPQTRSRRR